MINNQLKILNQELHCELTQNILPFWSTEMVDTDNGGFYGRIDASGKVYKEADKGCVLNARILWTFSTAYRILKKPDYLIFANRAKNYLLKYFTDKECGGFYWLVDYSGNVTGPKKQIYAQAFVIYALTEYYKATKDTESLQIAIRLYRIIEKYSYDKDKGGYFEAFSKDWGNIPDLRLSEKDANEKKTMNTHLHVLEAYTNLYRIWKDETLKNQLHKLIEIFIDKIVNKKSLHLNLFFDENWNDKTDMISYGHDIESSWLLYESAKVLGDQELLMKVRDICILIANASMEGLMPDGSMIYEKHFSGHSDTDRHWWVQAEALVGFINAYELTGNDSYLNHALAVWKFISDFIVDKKLGDWFWSVNDKLEPNSENDKAGFWKCPYHNSRMCFEIMERYKLRVNDYKLEAR